MIELGFKFGLGFALAVALGKIAIVALGAAVLPRDDSDPATGGRSGLRIYTDAATGVQYVGTIQGLHPRLNVDGSLKTREGP